MDFKKPIHNIVNLLLFIRSCRVFAIKSDFRFEAAMLKWEAHLKVTLKTHYFFN